jgi:hypothetical protein
MKMAFLFEKFSRLAKSFVRMHTINKLGLVFLVAFLCLFARSWVSTKEADAARAPQRSDNPVQVQHGAYWSIENGYQATLALSNTTGKPLSVWPILYDTAGARLDMGQVRLAPHEHTGIDLGQWLAALEPSPDASFTSGSLRLEHSGRTQFDLAALIMMTDTARSLRLDVPVLFNRVVSSRLEGLWWKLDDNSRVRILLTNVSDKPLSVHPTWYVDQVAQPSHPLMLNPHQCQELKVDQVLAAKAESALQGGLSLEYNGDLGSLMARGFVEHLERGFSSNLTFLDPEMPQSERLHGAQLFLGQTDALLGLPAGMSFTPWLLLRNTTTQPMRVEISVNYSIRANTEVAGQARIPAFTLAPQQVRRINLKESLRSVVQIPERIHSAGLEIEHDGVSGELVAQLTSVDPSGNFAFDMPIVDPVDLLSNAFNYPIGFERGSRTIVALKNARREDSRYSLQLVYAGGEYDLGIQNIAPGQTVTIDLQDLKERQVEDVNGNVISQQVRQGQVVWRQESGVGSVLGRAIVFQPAAATSSSFSCAQGPDLIECIKLQREECTQKTYTCGESPPAIEGDVGEMIQLHVCERIVNCCNKEELRRYVEITSQATFQSGSPAVASVTPQGRLTLNRVGETLITATYNAGPQPVCPNCGPEDEAPPAHDTPWEDGLTQFGPGPIGDPRCACFIADQTDMPFTASIIVKVGLPRLSE